jgi:hypothetical protein
MFDDFESELLDAKYRAGERSRLLMAPCPLCGLPPKVLAADVYGFPRTVEEFHAAGCAAFVPD